MRSAWEAGSPLSNGVYSVVDVARYAQLNASRVRSWLRGRSDGRGRGALLSDTCSGTGIPYAASFLDLIDVMVAGHFRSQGVSMGIVRAAYESLARHLDTQHPFCHSDLYTDGRRVFLWAAEGLADATLHEVVSRQQFFMHVRESLTRVDYSDESRLACRWNIADGVVIDPAVGRGKPVVRHTGVATYVLANQYAANRNDAAFVASLFNTSESDVLNAVEFERRFGGRRAA